jgi:hypothetical protein
MTIARIEAQLLGRSLDNQINRLWTLIDEDPAIGNGGVAEALLVADDAVMVLHNRLEASAQEPVS